LLVDNAAFVAVKIRLASWRHNSFILVTDGAVLLLARRLHIVWGETSNGCWCLSSSSVVCYAAGGRAGRSPGAWAADTARRASTVTFR